MQESLPRLGADGKAEQCAVVAPLQAIASRLLMIRPAGWTDHQEGGRYRLERRDDGALFGFAVGPQSWKRFLHPPVERLWTMRNGDDGVTISSGATRAAKFAF